MGPLEPRPGETRTTLPWEGATSLLPQPSAAQWKFSILPCSPVCSQYTCGSRALPSVARALQELAIPFYLLVIDLYKACAGLGTAPCPADRQTQ